MTRTGGSSHLLTYRAICCLWNFVAVSPLTLQLHAASVKFYLESADSSLLGRTHCGSGITEFTLLSEGQTGVRFSAITAQAAPTTRNWHPLMSRNS